MIDAQLQQPPNRRLQRTALRAHEIGAFLKAGFSPRVFPLSNAPPLKREPLGGISTERYHAHEGN